MNDFEIIIEEFINQNEANKGVNEFIRECSDNNLKIIDITSHIAVDPDGWNNYIFIYKVTKG